MSKNEITIMIISTIPDMFAEHYYFIKNVFPQLREICKNHDIDLKYRDLLFSMSEDEFNHCRSINRYFESIDLDRTFFICFRGQKLGCTPTPNDIDRLTIEQYPELVDYIGDTSFTELLIMHALHPFDKHFDGEPEFLQPVKHSLFYFRKDDYLSNLTCSQIELYTCSGDCGDSFVDDLRLAMAKDLVFNDKMEFDKRKDKVSNINIRKYDGIWNENIMLKDLIGQYAKEYADLNDLDVEDLMKVINNINVSSRFRGSFSDFKIDGEYLKDVMIEDFLNELKLEFPQAF